MGWDARDHAALAAVLIVCLAAFHRQLDWWFTGPDTFSLIRSSRVEAPGDLRSILFGPLMAGTGFTDLASFYRPTTQLSFTLDEALWGLDPTGYHLTNVLLHATATALVYALARRLTGARGRSLLAAAFFTLHPVIAESVPALSRRQDALATVFLLGSLIAYLRAREAPGRARGWMAGSLALALAAFGSKEVALVLPGVVLAHAWLVDRDAPGGAASLDRARWAATRATPYLALAGAFVAWRTAVLGGLGGYPDREPFVSGWVAWELGEYLTALVAPLRHAVIAMGLTGPELAVLLAALTAASVAGLLVLYWGELGGLAGDLGRFSTSRTGRVTAFCAVWLAGGGALFTAGRTFDDWSAYQFVVPFAIAVAGLLAGGAAALWRARGDEAGPRVVENRSAVAAGVVLLAGMVAVTLFHSPSVRGADGWETNGEVQRAVLVDLERQLDRSSRDVSQIHAHDIPWEDRSGGRSLDQVHTVYYFQDFTIEDYLALRSGGNATPEVEVESATALDEAPRDVAVELHPRSSRTADLYLAYESPRGAQASARVP